MFTISTIAEPPMEIGIIVHVDEVSARVEYFRHGTGQRRVFAAAFLLPRLPGGEYDLTDESPL